MQPFWDQHFLLPTQQHANGVALGELLESARCRVANMLGCDPSETVFTSGGTEANNLAILGVCRYLSQRGKPPGRLLVSTAEHDSIVASASSLVDQGWRVDYLPVENDGLVDPRRVEKMLQPDTAMVCLQAACGFSGVLQPVRKVADICHSRGVLLHCDAAQAAGKYPIDCSGMRADTIAISGHKMYGPKGIGALYVRRGLKLEPILFGESQEMGLRPGAGNIPGAIGMGAAALMANRADEVAGDMRRLRDRFENRLIETLITPPTILGRNAHRLPNTSLLHLPLTLPESFDRRIDDLVIARPRSVHPQDWMTRCLAGFGLSTEQARRCLRVSIGWTTSQDAVDQAAMLIAEAIQSR